MRGIAVILLAWVVARCGGRSMNNDMTPSAGGGQGAAGDGGAAGDSSAQRVEPWQLEADGTQPLILGPYDTQEKVHCRFVPDENGQQRCLPWGLAPLTERLVATASSPCR